MHVISDCGWSCSVIQLFSWKIHVNGLVTSLFNFCNSEKIIDLAYLYNRSLLWLLQSGSSQACVKDHLEKKTNCLQRPLQKTKIPHIKKCYTRAISEVMYIVNVIILAYSVLLTSKAVYHRKRQPWSVWAELNLMMHNSCMPVRTC